MAVRYTDDVIPSGTGTRIVSYSAPVFFTATGDPLPGEMLAEMQGVLQANYRESLQRLTELADAEFAQMAAV
jgi:hypothetical protein